MTTSNKAIPIILTERSDCKSDIIYVITRKVFDKNEKPHLLIIYLYKRFVGTGCLRILRPCTFWKPIPTRFPSIFEQFKVEKGRWIEK